MRWAIPCLTCGAEIRHMHELFWHEPICRPRQFEQLREREAAARREGWQLRKQHNRLERKIYKQTQHLKAGGGVLLAKRILDTARQAGLSIL
jgi:hypothetical protein